MQRREISQILMRRICVLMEESPSFQEPYRKYVGIARPEPYVFTEVTLEADEPLAKYLLSKGWKEVGCEFSSYYTCIEIREIEVTPDGWVAHKDHPDRRNLRKCLRLRELSVA